MKPIKSEDLPQEIIDKMNPKDRSDMGLKTTEEINKETDAKREKNVEIAEREIQNQVEAYLIHLGYERRTPESIGRGMPQSGYQIHIHAAKRNPILGDLLVLSHSGRYLEIELKTTTGSPTKEQACLIAYGSIQLARSAEEACEIIREWHTSLTSS